MQPISIQYGRHCIIVVVCANLRLFVWHYANNVVNGIGARGRRCDAIVWMMQTCNRVNIVGVRAIARQGRQRALRNHNIGRQLVIVDLENWCAAKPRSNTIRTGVVAIGPPFAPPTKVDCYSDTQETEATRQHSDANQHCIGRKATIGQDNGWTRCLRRILMSRIVFSGVNCGRDL